MGGVEGGLDGAGAAKGFTLEVDGVNEAVGVHNEHVAGMQLVLVGFKGSLWVNAQNGAAFGEIGSSRFIVVNHQGRVVATVAIGEKAGVGVELGAKEGSELAGVGVAAEHTVDADDQLGK